MAKESAFEAALIRKLEHLFPGCIILKNDPLLKQGIPDRLILYGPRWAAFEVKRSQSSTHQKNQDYYVELMDEMSYASFVYPQNEEVFLREIQQALRPSRSTRLSKR